MMLRTSLLPVALAVLCVACSDATDRAGSQPELGSDVESEDRPTERMARRFLPRDDEWRLESQIPEEPQETPGMVIWELSAHADRSEATRDERAAAAALVERCWASAREKGWFDFQKGLADGFKLLPADRRHYYNEEFIFDDALLDCERPEFLMYYGTPAGKHLAGLMFYTRRIDEPGPQVGGPLTVWHYHVWSKLRCFREGLLFVSDPNADGGCDEGIPSHRSPEMIHIWFLDHPGGRFATDMRIEQSRLRELIARRDAAVE